uniref:CUB domain-containing protein n=1 Tax=Ciona savignyi TaxID=51511 RepID=H2Z662_CIOSA
MFVIITTILFASLLSPQQTFAQVPVCGGRLTSDAGTFHTPHYPHEYDTNTMCKWVIEVPVGRVVELKFSNFDIDADYEPEKCPMDRVQVHDGETTNSPSLGGVLCGQETPDAITSTGRFMTVLFQSRDDSIGGVGFQAAYKALPGVDHPRCIMNSCGGEISDKVNCEIQSPGYPSGYADNLNCTWVIRAPSGVGKVVFTFMEADFNRKMDGKCSMNNVTVYDGANIKSKVIYEPNCDTRDNRLKTTVF